MPKNKQEALKKYPYVKEESPHRHKIISGWEEKNKELDFERSLITTQDGQKIIEKDGKEHSVSFTQEELKKFDNKDAILTHNHPRDIGFSSTDFKFARDLNLKEMRAVGKYRTFIMERPGKYTTTGGVEREGWPTEQELNGEIRRATARVSRKIKKEIDSGKSSWTFANSNHHHLLAEELARKLKIKYEVRATK